MRIMDGFTESLATVVWLLILATVSVVGLLMWKWRQIVFALWAWRMFGWRYTWIWMRGK